MQRRTTASQPLIHLLLRACVPACTDAQTQRSSTHQSLFAPALWCGQGSVLAAAAVVGIKIKSSGLDAPHQPSSCRSLRRSRTLRRRYVALGLVQGMPGCCCGTGCVCRPLAHQRAVEKKNTCTRKKMKSNTVCFRRALFNLAVPCTAKQAAAQQRVRVSPVHWLSGRVLQMIPC